MSAQWLWLGPLWMGTAVFVWAAPPGDEPRQGDKTLREWQAQLKEAGGPRRAEALGAIARFDPREAEPALPALRALLKDPDLAVRVRAAIALWAVAQQSDGTAAVLAEGLQSPDADLRLLSLRTLGEMGPGAKGAAGAVVGLLWSRGPNWPPGLVIQVGNLGAAAVPPLLARVKADDRNVRQMAAEMLGTLGPPARPAVPLIVAAFADADPATRVRLARSTLRIDPDQEKALAVLVEAHAGPNPDTRRESWSALIELRSNAKSLLPVYLDALKEKDLRARSWAVAALWRIDRRTKETLPVLHEMLKSPQRMEVEAAVRLVGTIGPDARPLLPELLALSKSPLYQLPNGAVADALAKLGPAVVPDLRRMVREGVPPQRLVGLRALWQIDAKAASAAAAAEFERAESYPRQQIVREWAEWGPLAGPAVPRLRAWLKEGKGQEQETAVRALRAMGPVAKAALPELLAITRKARRPAEFDATTPALTAIAALGRGADPAVAELVALLKERTTSSSGRQMIVHTLACCSRPAARAALPALLDLASTESSVARGSAFLALARIDPAGAEWEALLVRPLHAGAKLPTDRAVETAWLVSQCRPDARRAVPALMEACKSADERARLAYLDALGEYGPAARAAAPLLKPLLAKKEAHWQIAAARALVRVGAEKEAVVATLAELLRARDRVVPTLEILDLAEELGPAARGLAPEVAQMVPITLGYTGSARPAEVLVRIAPHRARTLLPRLRAAVVTREVIERDRLAYLLWKLEPQDPAPVAALVATLDDPEEHPCARATAADGLGRIGPAARDAERALVRALKHPDPLLRARVARALCLVTGKAEPGLSALTDLLKDTSRHPSDRIEAARALGDLGPAARPALAALRAVYTGEEAADLIWAAMKAVRPIDAKEAREAGLP